MRIRPNFVWGTRSHQRIADAVYYFRQQEHSGYSRRVHAADVGIEDGQEHTQQHHQRNIPDVGTQIGKFFSDADFLCGILWVFSFVYNVTSFLISKNTHFMLAYYAKNCARSIIDADEK